MLREVNGIFSIRFLPRLLLAFLLAALPAPVARAAGLPRERGAYYLEDFLDQPYRLKVLGAGPISFNADQARYLGTLRAGQLVELQAVSENGALCRVRGLASQGQVAGWIAARYLSPIDPAFVDGMRRSLARRDRVNALVAANEVALGMTSAEVTASLGAPPKRSTRTDAGGVTERWEYVRYVVVPRVVTGLDPFGRYVTNTIYERVPAGSYAGGFTNEGVSAAEKHAGTLAGAGQAKIVPPPVNLRY